MVRKDGRRKEGNKAEGRKGENEGTGRDRNEEKEQKKKKRAWFFLKSFLRRLEYLCKLHIRLDFYGDLRAIIRDVQIELWLHVFVYWFLRHLLEVVAFIQKLRQE